MARRASVRYYASRGAYFTHFRGRQHKLADGPDDAPNGPTYLAALKTFHEMMVLSTAGKQGDNNTVAVICELYARHLEEQGRKKSLKLFLDTSVSAVAAFGEKTVRELIPYNVTTWLAEMTKTRTTATGKVVSWGESMRALAVKNLRTALNWAVLQGLIKNHCLQVKGSVTARARSRGREARIPEDAAASIFAAANRRLHDLMTFMAETGCRPAEAYHVEARYYRRDDGCVLYPHNAKPPDFIHKTAKKTKKDRVIYLTPTAVEIVERLCRQYPEGPIFRNRDRKQWCDSTAVKAMRAIRAKLKLDIPVTAYSWRHTFATKALECGMPIKTLADLMGTSVAMIEYHYGHAHDNRRAMRDALLGFMAP